MKKTAVKFSVAVFTAVFFVLSYAVVSASTEQVDINISSDGTFTSASSTLMFNNLDQCYVQSSAGRWPNLDVVHGYYVSSGYFTCNTTLVRSDSPFIYTNFYNFWNAEFGAPALPPFGDYWIAVKDNTTGDNKVFQFTVAGGVYTRYDIGLDTIAITSPSQDDVVASTTTTITGSYTKNPNSQYDEILFSVRHFGAAYPFYASSTPISGNSGTFSFPFTGTATSSYVAQVTLSIAASSSEQFSINNIVYDTVTFSLIASSALYNDQHTTTYEDFDCSISNLSGCLQRALWWAFVPSQSDFDKFQNIQTMLGQRLPFAYVNDIEVMVGEMLPDTVATSSGLVLTFTPHMSLNGATSTLNILTQGQVSAMPFAAPIKTAMGYILYVITAFVMYEIVQKYFIHHS